MIAMPNDPREGERRRDEALMRVRGKHPVRVWQTQLALLVAMRSRSDRTGSSDDCTPEGEQYRGNAPWLGAAVRMLAEQQLIVRAGWIKSARPSRKSNEIKLWRLRDDAAADVAIRTLRRTLGAMEQAQRDNPTPDDVGLGGLFH